MTILRAPVEIRGDVPGLLVRGMPVARHDGTAPGVVSAVVSDFCCYIAEVPADYFARYHDPYTRRSRCLDWTSPLAIYAALHWLADRGHPCLWMLPTTHGGRVEAWDGLSAWEVSAILVSVSVGRVAGGKWPVGDLALCWTPAHGGKYEYAWKGWQRCWASHAEPVIVRDETFGKPKVESGWRYCNQRGPETGDPGKLAADRAALTDGAALCVDGGIAVGVP